MYSQVLTQELKALQVALIEFAFNLFLNKAR